jgi:ribosomal protein L30E
MLKGCVGGQDGVVWFNHSSGDLGCWVNGEFKLGLLAIIDRETFHQ